MPTDEKIKVTGKRVTTWIPSSAPPPAPERAVRRADLRLGSRSERRQEAASSWRRGAGLRVYLDRPWNVSGYGEMLAVVARAGFVQGRSERGAERAPATRASSPNGATTRSGRARSSAASRRDAATFRWRATEPDASGRLAAACSHRRTEADQPPGPFQVTGLAIRQWPVLERRTRRGSRRTTSSTTKSGELWYCDIEVDTGAVLLSRSSGSRSRATSPSRSTARTSRSIVLADFMSLAPDRWLNVKRTKDARTRRVVVSGADLQRLGRP